MGRLFYCLIRIVKIKLSHQILLGLCLMLLSMSHWFPLGVNPLELLGAFAHFTLILTLFIGLVAAFVGLRSLATLGLASFLITATLVLPYFMPSELDGHHQFTVGQFNLYHHNPTPEDALVTISKSNPDLFTIQELNSDWKALVDSAFGVSHPYKIEDPWDSCCYGLGFYSRHPIISFKKLHFEGIPYYDIMIQHESKVLRAICFHTQAPAFPNKTVERDAQLKAVSKMLGQKENTIVLGDWNIVPWDSKFKRFIEESHLIEVREGFQATYPMNLGVPLIPIDHITYKGGLEAVFCNAVSLPGSDHRGLVASFAFKE
jgi:endonuclease/exonuclease/phosphatase (EEP) superfamily protein YafD